MPLGLGREPQVRCHAEWHAWECQMLWEMVHIYGLLSASGKSERSVLSVVLHTRKQTQRDKHSEELMHPSSSRARIETQVLLCAAIPCGHLCAAHKSPWEWGMDLWNRLTKVREEEVSGLGEKGEEIKLCTVLSHSFAVIYYSSNKNILPHHF